MYVALAARPLPKWFHLILSVLLFNLSCAIVYVYIMTRNITTSTERFESVPSYVVAVLFFLSGCLSLSMTKSVINESVRVAQLGVLLSLATIIIAVAAIICTLWLADIQDKFLVCIYNAQHSQCICRNDNVTDSQDDNWYVYERISGCNRLDSLNRCMIASVALDAVGAFVCFLAFSNFGLIWVRQKTENRRRGNRSLAVYGNSSLNGSRRQRGRSVLASNGIVAAEGGSGNLQGSPTAANASGSHSDWDGWLFSHPLFRQLFSEFRHAWFPPTYEQSQMTTSSTNDGQVTLVNVTTTADSSEQRQRRLRSVSPISPPPSLNGGSMLSVALGDYPPPPYSKTPRRKYGMVAPKRPENNAVPSVHVTNATTSSFGGRISEHVTTQNCV